MHLKFDGLVWNNDNVGDYVNIALQFQGLTWVFS